MNVGTEVETLYWSDSATYGELFSNESSSGGVYYGLLKDYRIEMKTKDGVIEQLKIFEDVHLRKGHEDDVDALKKFYQRRNESDVYNHDIVNFDYDERYMYDERHNNFGLVITINCKELNTEKHNSLIKFLGFQESLNGVLLSYDLYKTKLLKMGFEINE